MRGRAPAFCGVLIGLLLLVAAASADAAPANGRAWELVTPSEATGSSVFQGLGRVIGVSEDGDGIVYESVYPPPGATAGEFLANNLMVRTGEGWRLQPASFSFEVPIAILDLLVSPRLQALNGDLGASVHLSHLPLAPGDPDFPKDGRQGLYRVDAGGATLMADLGKAVFAGASSDLTHVLLSSSDHLLPSDAGRTSGESIYEWVGFEPRQVDLGNDGSLLSACGSSISRNGGISDSGAQIFFEHPASSVSDPLGTCGLRRRVFLRQAGSSTVEISASQCTRPDCGEPGDVSFAGAAADGSVAFLATAQQLTNADEDSLRDLYRYEVGSGELSLVSAGPPSATGEFIGQVESSVDGSKAYFRAQGRLIGDEGSAAGLNLYIADASGLRFVSETMEADDLLVSRDGRVALIATAASLEAADADERVDAYLYESAGDRLTRISSGPGGGNGAFDAGVLSAIPVGGGILNTRVDAPFHGSLTAGGGRAFFETAEPLVADDRNEAVDVYEWTAGSLGLVSSGSGEDDAQLSGSNADGSTVLIKTAASLLPRDRDGGDRDIYAARIGGGFPEPADPPTCDVCRSGPAGPLARPRPATVIAPRRDKVQIGLRRPGADAGAKVLATGTLLLTISVPAPGKVEAEARARLGGEYRTAASGIAGATRPGRLQVRLTATPSARRQLAREGSLRLRLVLRQGPSRLERELVLTAKGRR